MKPRRSGASYLCGPSTMSEIPRAAVLARQMYAEGKPVHAIRAETIIGSTAATAGCRRSVRAVIAAADASGDGFDLWGARRAAGEGTVSAARSSPAPLIF
jgi:hypothetical protein